MFKEVKVFEGVVMSVVIEIKIEEKKGVYKYLMMGVLYMFFFVIVGGLLIVVFFMFGIEVFKIDDFVGLLKVLMDIGGGVVFYLMIVVFVGYVVFLIVDCLGLVVGFIGGMLVIIVGVGILGGIVVGFFVGYVV